MRTFCCWLLLLLALNSAAQENKPQRIKYPPHQLAVGVNPLALLNPDPRLMFSMERRIATRWSVVGDAGVVVSSTYMQEKNKVRGFELRPALRYYYTREGSGYVQGQLHYRLVHYKMHDWLGMDCINDVPTYEKLQDFTFRKQQLGAALVTGGVERLGPHWLLDVSVGLGLVYRTQEVAGKENCCYLPDTGMFGGAEQGNVVIPVVPISVKLAYVIK